MGYFIPKKLGCDFDRKIPPTGVQSKIYFYSTVINDLVEKVLKESKISEKTKGILRSKYQIEGFGNDLREAKGEFLLKLYETCRSRTKIKKKTIPEKQILEQICKYISQN